IPTVAGTYNVTFNRLTGEYNFATLSVGDFTTSKAKVYPNPSQNVWNFSIENDSIEKIQIVDVTGKIIVDKLISSNLATIDATALTSGIYFAKVKTNTAVQTIKLVRN
ncbi:MAG TPA: T9SS type A sorting domain-containing protein, partial [Flavobacterium sp.]|nr:T9SS type A sorting domain-containing protein [Flavobacterium sp.]